MSHYFKNKIKPRAFSTITFKDRVKKKTKKDMNKVQKIIVIRSAGINCQHWGKVI